MLDFYFQVFLFASNMERLFSALPTPFLGANCNEIDYKSLEKLIDFQVKNDVEGLVFSGSTGEGHTLTKSEWHGLIAFGVKKVREYNKKYNKTTKIVAGVGFNCTLTAVEYAKIAEELAADYILATVPYYNKPQQDGIYTHFAKIAGAVKTPIILYNVPGRTVTDMQNDTIVRLAKDFKNVVALKDATGKLERVAELKKLLDDANCVNFVMLSGEDATQIGFNAMGGQGVISVVANIAPKLCADIQNACKSCDYSAALALQNELVKLSKAMFCEPNPVPVKYALTKMGIFDNDTPREPLVKLGEKGQKIVDEVLKKL